MSLQPDTSRKADVFWVAQKLILLLVPLAHRCSKNLCFNQNAKLPLDVFMGREPGAAPETFLLSHVVAL